MNTMNIIAFSGTHGTGKSTQAYNLASKCKTQGFNVIVIDELARECPLKINKESSQLTQYWILASQIKREIEVMHRYKFVISDRCIFDTLAYAVVLNLLDKNWTNLIAEYVRNNYYRIYLLEPNAFNYQINDGVRDMDTQFRIDVHNTLINLYNQANIKYNLIESQETLNVCTDILIDINK